MEELLRYDHVDISYNGIPAVQDVSFTRAPARFSELSEKAAAGNPRC